MTGQARDEEECLCNFLKNLIIRTFDTYWNFSGKKKALI